MISYNFYFYNMCCSHLNLLNTSCAAPSSQLSSEKITASNPGVYLRIIIQAEKHFWRFTNSYGAHPPHNTEAGQGCCSMSFAPSSGNPPNLHSCFNFLPLTRPKSNKSFLLVRYSIFCAMYSVTLYPLCNTYSILRAIYSIIYAIHSLTLHPLPHGSTPFTETMFHECCGFITTDGK